jgi:hypothetical protein
MPNGKPGDDPLTDMLYHGMHPFPADIEDLLRRILAQDPDFPDGKRRYLDQVQWFERFMDWAAGRNLEDGRRALNEVLGALQDEDRQ